MSSRILLGVVVLVGSMAGIAECALVTYTFDATGANTSGFTFDPDGVGGAPSVFVSASVGNGSVVTNVGTFFVTSDSDLVTRSASGLGVHWDGSIPGSTQPFADRNLELDGYLPEVLQLSFAEDVSLVSATITHSHSGAAPSATAVVTMDGNSLGGYSETMGVPSVFLDFSALNAIDRLGSSLTFETPPVIQSSADDFAYRVYSVTVETSEVPEPASTAIWSILGIVGLVAVRRRRRNAMEGWFPV